jgi:hypothetical protein
VWPGRALNDDEDWSVALLILSDAEAASPPGAALPYGGSNTVSSPTPATSCSSESRMKELSVVPNVIA